jgi:N-acetylglucosamine kinase-like BadF-type ATPase
MKAYFLGMDVGGTKTHALIADEDGQVLGFGQAGGGNPEGGRYSELAAATQAALSEALVTSGLTTPAIAGAGFGIGGYDWPCDHNPTLEALAPLGLYCPVEVANDAVIGLLAGAEQGWGIAIVSGTGTNCRGRDHFGREGRVTGEGIDFGEFGGSSELVWKAIHQVNYEWIRRGPPTQLTRLFLELTGARDAFDLMEGIARNRIQTNSSWARAIFQVAEAGDAVAQELIAWSGRELGEMACAVIRQLKLEDEAFEVVLIGSLFKGGNLLIEPLSQTVKALAPWARLARLEAPPVVGGVLLGMQAAGINGPSAQNLAACRSKLIESSRALMINSGE